MAGGAGAPDNEARDREDETLAESEVLREKEPSTLLAELSSTANVSAVCMRSRSLVDAVPRRRMEAVLQTQSIIIFISIIITIIIIVIISTTTVISSSIAIRAVVGVGVGDQRHLRACA